MKKEDKKRKEEREKLFLKLEDEVDEEKKALSEWYKKRKTDPNAPCPQDKIRRRVFYVAEEYELLELHCEAPFTWTSIGDFNNFIERYFDTAIETFKRQNKREPSLQEFKKHFIEKMKNMEDSGYCYAVVNRDCNEKEFKKFITAKRKVYKEKKKAKEPVIRKRDEVEKYLKVLEWKEQGLKGKKIIENYIKEYLPNHNKERINFESLRVELHRYSKKGENIKKNFNEKGVFPGKY